MYLERPLVSELKAKLAALFHVDSEHISRVLKQGQAGIRVLVSDEVRGHHYTSYFSSRHKVSHFRDKGES